MPPPPPLSPPRSQERPAGAVDTTPVDTAPADATPADATLLRAAPVDAALVHGSRLAPALGDPTPLAATPADPTPVDATPADATPADATLLRAAPVDAALVHGSHLAPALGEPTPLAVTPADTTPVDTAPVDATPADATLLRAAPVDAALVHGSRLAPALGDPTPLAVTPADPTPVDATPVDATPADATLLRAAPVDAALVHGSHLAPALGEPTPLAVTPADTTPVDATPVDATPADATLLRAAPVDAALVHGSHLAPALGDPTPLAVTPADPTLDDTELARARAALAQGRLQPARSLLARTGDDWDRRGHRITVLALDPYAAARAHAWLLAEPGRADAAVLLALAHVRRALRGKDTPATARASCRAAAEAAPADPTPWLGLLMLEREGTADAVRIFEEVRARHRDHHHAHHLMIALLAERRADAGPDQRHEVYDFASWAAERAPADSPLAILPIVAHAERYRALAVRGHAPADPTTAGHWRDHRAADVMQAAFDWWLEWEHDGHPRRLVDLNFLAHAKFCEGRPAEAAALFHRIGDHVTPAPWSYPDRDPYAAFRAARTAALGPERPPAEGHGPGRREVMTEF